MNKLDLFPDDYRNQESLAESALVEWLRYSDVLSEFPDEIQLVDAIDKETECGDSKYYMFRFRMNPPHPKSQMGWLIGCSGPFLGDEADLSYSFETGSAFQKDDGRAMGQHLIEILGRGE